MFFSSMRHFNANMCNSAPPNLSFSGGIFIDTAQKVLTRGLAYRFSTNISIDKHREYVRLLLSLYFMQLSNSCLPLSRMVTCMRMTENVSSCELFSTPDGVSFFFISSLLYWCRITVNKDYRRERSSRTVFGVHARTNAACIADRCD